MKRTLITIALAAQLAAAGAFAQTSNTTTGMSSGAGSVAFGSDWSTTLGSAMFGEDGTTVRQSTELSTQWNTLSEEDKSMIQRDCMVYMQQTGGATGTTGAATGTTAAPATTGSSDTAGATGTTGVTGTTGTTTGSTADATTGTAAGDGSTPMTVTMEQMEQICAATKDL